MCKNIKKVIYISENEEINSIKLDTTEIDITNKNNIKTHYGWFDIINRIEFFKDIETFNKFNK